MKKFTRFAVPLIVSITALTGCVNAARYPSPRKLTNAIGLTFSGHPVQDMIVMYGMPDQKMEIGKETVYAWRVSRSQFYEDLPPARYTCELDAYVRQNGVVRTIGLNGQNGACFLFAL